MGVNSYIRFGISKSGRYLLDYIPTEDINRYLHRLQNYSVNYEVVNRDRKLELTQQQVCYLLFFDIEKRLIDKLKAAYGFIDTRSYSIAKSKNLMCFILDNKYIIAFKKDLSHQMTNYFNQHIGFTYKLISVENYKICIPNINLSDVILEDINNSIGISNEHDSDEESRERLFKLRQLINNYQKEIIISKQKQAFFNVGSCFGYPQR